MFSIKLVKVTEVCNCNTCKKEIAIGETVMEFIVGGNVFRIVNRMCGDCIVNTVKKKKP